MMGRALWYGWGVAQILLGLYVAMLQVTLPELSLLERCLLGAAGGALVGMTVARMRRGFS